MSQLKLMPCPNPMCLSSDVGCEDYNFETHHSFTVECCCGVAGPRCRTETEAIKAWNRLFRPYTWSKKLPKKPGWYWWRWANFQEAVCLEVRAGLIVEYPHGKLQNIKDIGGEWGGFIPAPCEKNQKV